MFMPANDYSCITSCNKDKLQKKKDGDCSSYKISELLKSNIYEFLLISKFNLRLQAKATTKRAEPVNNKRP